jgi:hypothetical protein
MRVSSPQFCPRCRQVRSSAELIVSVGPVTVGTYSVHHPGVSPGPNTSRLLGVHRQPVPYGIGFIETPVFEPLPLGPGWTETCNEVERRATDAAGKHHADFPDELPWTEGGPGCRTCRDQALNAHRQRDRENNKRRDQQLRALLDRRPRAPLLPPSAFEYIQRPTFTRAFVLSVLVAAAYSLYRDIDAGLRIQRDLGTVLAENIQLLIWAASQFSLQLTVPIALALLLSAFLYDCVARPIRRTRQNRYVTRDGQWRAEVVSTIATFQKDGRILKESWTPSSQAMTVARESPPAPAARISALGATWDTSSAAVSFGLIVWVIGLAFRHVLIGL